MPEPMGRAGAWRAAWQRFAAAYRMELRLLCLHWSFPVLHLLWAGFVLLLLRPQVTMGTARSGLTEVLGTVAIGLFSVAALFVAAASASRSRWTGFDALEATFPTGAEVFAGRWLAGWTGVMTGVIAPLAAAALEGPLASFWAAVPEFLTEAAIALAFATALAWWIMEWAAASPAMRRWIYPLLGIGWLGLGVAERVLVSLEMTPPGIGLLDLMRLNHSRYTEIWGYLQEGTLPLWFNRFYLGLALLLILLVAGRRQAAARGRFPPVIGAALVAAVALTIWAAAGYRGVVADWHDRGTALVEASQAAVETDDPDAEATAVDGYDLTVDLTRPPRMAVRATLTLRNQGTAPLHEALLTLHPDLAVEDAGGLTFHREGPLLRLRLPEPLQPGERTRVELSYAGALLSIRPGPDPYPAYFTDKAGVWLSARAGWYPLPGQVSLVPYGGPHFHPPAAFRVQVAGPAGWRFGSNLPEADEGGFAAPSATWAALVGSPRLAVERYGPVTLVAGRDHVPALRPHLKRFARAVELAQPFFPDAEVQGMTVMVVESFNLSELIPAYPTPGQLLTVLPRDRFAQSGGEMDEMVPVVEALWMLGRDRWNPRASNAVARFLWRYAQRVETGEDPSQLPEAPRPGIEAALWQVYDRGGVEAVARAIRAMQTDGLALSDLEPAEQEDWIRAAAFPGEEVGRP